MNILLRWSWVPILVLVLDQYTKHMATSELVKGVPKAVFPGLNMNLAHNCGGAWSLLADAGAWTKWFFLIVAISVSIGIIVWLYRLEVTERFKGFALAMVLGGALGNLYDRLTVECVVDFIQVYYDRWAWPTFNIADSAISVGAVFLIYIFYQEGKAEKQQKASS